MNPTSNALHGDGLNFPFFNLLWSKDSGGNDGDLQSDERNISGSKQSSSPPIRVPDTVVFLFGQPHQWYFTSKQDKQKTTVLRKRRANLTLANIEEVFLRKAGSRGEVGDDDVVAYFIECSNGDEAEMVDEKKRENRNASLDACSTVVDNEVACNIEYLNKKTLREFLQQGRNNKSGILQRFIAPHGGGRHNAQIRAIWTPKLCILERRRTKQDLHDTRFALYERAITFDGPDVHSVSVPLRGTVLAGRVESICNEIVRHISKVAAENTRGASRSLSSNTKRDIDSDAFLGVARMVLNFKVDGNGKIWILYSNSIRLQSVSVDRTRLTESADTHSSKQSVLSQPLNMETVVRLPSSIKLTQEPNHKADTKLDNRLSFTTCPSCNNNDADAHFQPVPYKTIIQHFEKTLEMLAENDESHPSKVWPPEDDFIKAAGSVGFGSLCPQLARDRDVNPKIKYTEETHAIPPVIRQIHPKLRAKGYTLYRNDPMFLLKTCSVCEDCFLAYAQLTSTSYTMTLPVEPCDTDKDLHYTFPPSEGLGRNNKPRGGGGKKNAKAETSSASAAHEQSSIFGKDFGRAPPELPPAIIDPPKTANSEESSSTAKDTLFNTLGGRADHGYD